MIKRTKQILELISIVKGQNEMMKKFLDDIHYLKKRVSTLEGRLTKLQVKVRNS